MRLLAYFYNRRTQGYHLEPLRHDFKEQRKDIVRIGLAISLTRAEFRYRCKRKIRNGTLLRDYSNIFVIYRRDLKRWTVSDLPF